MQEPRTKRGAYTIQIQTVQKPSGTYNGNEAVQSPRFTVMC